MKDYEIVSKRDLASNVVEYNFYAPYIAKHCLAGQFIILRVDEEGERVPFTICDYSREFGTVCILVQTVGYSTLKMSKLTVGDCFHDVVGPLGNATDLSKYKNVLLVGGGIGLAVIYPQAKQLKAEGKKVEVAIGARNTSLLLYMDEFKAITDNLYLITDDGSSGKKGFVTDVIKELVEGGKHYDAVFAVGPLPMMRAVCNLAKQYNIETIVSMNSIMVDGTGMCGCCRLSVDGKTKYACIDGPEFNGNLVDWDEAIARSRIYKEEEQEHLCNLRREYGEYK